MPLELRKTSQWWYGRYQANGKIHCVNLGVKAAGRRPASLTENGDAAFERSRGRAQEALDRVLSDVRRQKSEEKILEKLYELRTGHSIRRVPLEDLAKAWEHIPRKRPPSERYADQCRAVIGRLQQYIAVHHPPAADTTLVTPDMAAGFMESETRRGISASTWNDVLKTMRTTFRHVLPSFHTNPFSGIPLRETNPVHRKPYTPDELQLILKAAEDDDFVRPLVITAMCTAMRRGDCCQLKWAEVDLDQRFITVKTSKTGEHVEIPIFPLLHAELLKWKGRSETYVFPDQAGMYRVNPDGISHRVGRVLHAAGFVPEDKIPADGNDRKRELPMAAPDEVMAMARENMGPVEGATTTRRKKQNMLRALETYMAGADIDQVSRELGFSKGCVHNYLSELEVLCGVQVVRRRDGHLCSAESVIGPKQAVRAKGKRKASLRDFHSFRVTWITLALGAGVPLELVKRVTGHRTTDIVLKHYFRPDRESFRRVLQNAMPALLHDDRPRPSSATVPYSTEPRLEETTG